MMRKKLKVILGGLAGLLLCACTEQEALNVDGLIRLGAKADIYTRASVNDLAGLSAVGKKVGVYGVVTEHADAASQLLTDEWGTNLLMSNVRTSGIDASTGVLSWEGAYAYPLEEGRFVKFCVYHPYAAAGTTGDNYVEASAKSSPILHFKLTGAEDVMWVQPVVGSRTLSPAPLVFDHRLTQLRFRLTDDEGNFADTQVTGLVFNGVNTVSTLNLETGKLGVWGTPSDGISFPLHAPVAITGTSDAPQNLPGEVMLQPGLAEFKLTVKTDKKGDFPNVVIRPTGGENTFAAGRSYLVTLKFRERTPVALSAVVTPWIMDGTGEGTVD
ncbi:fimbrillin family protein [Bacteroides sp.]|uniref:fimbrillin family protein n=1 Tax=Bacteroides sp. TaxID=29523 RepID=UPI00261D8329|nr:fimbrillin family protein [Bacteroides sp.]